ncbi:MAG: AMP-binding protein [Acidobacteriota bacterium]
MAEEKPVKLSTLLDLLPLMERHGKAEAIRYNNGYRTFVRTYEELLRSIAGCADYFTKSGLTPGNRILLWGENRPEWIIAFWAGITRGLEVVPIDPNASDSFIQAIREQTDPGLLVYSENLNPEKINLPRLSFHALNLLPPVPDLNPRQTDPRDTVEIVFTSGTTGHPKGVVHSHRNLCAVLQPLSEEIDSFSRYLKFLKPVRVLSILPLGHMFGQTLGLFVPVLLKGAVVLTGELNPKKLIQQIHREKVMALVTVPGALEGLRNTLEAQHDCTRRIRESPGKWGFLKRWLRFRDVHRRFGWRFLALVAGGAQLRISMERWWSQLGFLLVQGYGLTEASPIVAMNNPLRVKSGSLGRVLEGQSVRIAGDGEILVRGDNVARYHGASSPAGEDGWLHTGDIGRIDAEGNLYFLGRKKDVIVTRDGHNVYPEDVEALLRERQEVKDCAVIGLETEKGTGVHAVLISAESNADIDSLVKSVNKRLEPHQRICGWSFWPKKDFPRTPSTGKIKRGQVAEVLNQSPRDRGEPGPDTLEIPSLEGILSRFVTFDPKTISDQHRLAEDLGMSSLDRIELLTLLEEKLGLDLDEDALAAVSTWGDLRRICEPGARRREESITTESAGKEASPPRAGGLPAQPGKETARRQELPSLSLPRGSRHFPVRVPRFLFRTLFVIPFSRFYLRLAVSGRDNLEGLKPPVIFAANHTSHLDVPVILSALPFSWRGRLAPAMLQEYFMPLLEPAGYGLYRRFLSRLKYLLTCHLLKAYPLPQRTGGMLRALRFTGELVEAGDCPLIFPEGRRTPDGLIHEFQPGVGLMSKKLDLPVVPIRIQGSFELYSIRHSWPRPGRVSLSFGHPLFPSPDVDAAAFSAELRKRIKELG